jgi:hypothetical protein
MARMMHRARQEYFDTIDDPFGSSLILSADRDVADYADKQITGVESHVRSTAIAPPRSGIEDSLLAEYHIAEIGFSYGTVDIANSTAAVGLTAENEPVYSTSDAILSLFGTATSRL